MEEFRKWVENIKNFIEERVGKFTNVWVDSLHRDIFNVKISFPQGQIFWMSFDRIEFYKNNEKQRCDLVKIRQQNLANQIEDFGKTLIKTTKSLK